MIAFQIPEISTFAATVHQKKGGIHDIFRYDMDAFGNCLSSERSEK
jgi:hypothetical protein